MRVLTLTPFYPTASNDAEGCFVAEAVVSLAALGVASEVIAVQPWYKPMATPRSGLLASRRVRYFSWPGNGGLAGTGRALCRVLNRWLKAKQEQPFRLLHAHAALPCGHAALLTARNLAIPYVVTVHGLDAFLAEQVGGRAGRKCAELVRSVYEGAARVVCISGKVAEIVEKGTNGKARIEVVHNGVDTDLFFPADEKCDSPVVLSVGNLIPVKGHDLLLRAVASLPGSQSQVKVRIIGEGPERPRLEMLCRELKLGTRVEFLGRRTRSEVAHEMRSCTVFALPSRYEGLGCVYLEAMASGKPVIACRGQGIEEVISPGENGFLVSPDQLRELIEMLQQLLRDDRLRLRVGRAARERVLQDLTLQHQAAKLRAIYEACAA
jgi:glycosyltransferase involved in cell wall biosynthesis